MGHLADTNYAVFGIGFSINSPAVVALDNDGKVFGCFFVNDTKKFLGIKCPLIESEYRAPRKRKTKKQEEEDLDLFRCRRNVETAQLLKNWIRQTAYSMNCDGILMSMEGYATGTTTARYLDIAEAAGFLKAYLLDPCVEHSSDVELIRIHDPLTVKKWATGSAYSSKYHMRSACDFSVPEAFFKQGAKFKLPVALPDGKVLTHDISGPGADIIDAYQLAKMLWTELMIRSGRLLTKDLPDEQIEIFNRVTKSYPQSLLSRSFV